MVLEPPVEPMLAQAAESIPPAHVLAAGVAYEQKFDGHRALLFTPTTGGGRVLLQARRGALVQDRFPDIVAAAAGQLPQGLVLDGRSRAACRSMGCSAGPPPAPAPPQVSRRRCPPTS
ncbi:hypothetical protein ACGFXC_33530 [Streptomyces sp. NPDC048507]|uniref:ATP-dependent DNA ligase n=1 Tax=Streptomyces sp. NPDC048507 TaxID=3365560 RepID=UPI00371E8FA5